jgi:hypothetical protein
VAGLQGAVAAYPGGRIAVLTHAGVIMQVLGLVRHRPAAVWSRNRPVPLTATEVLWQHGRPPAILAFNEPDGF